MERPEEDDVVKDRHYQKFVKKRKPEDEFEEDEEFIARKKKPLKGKPRNDDLLEDL